MTSAISSNVPVPPGKAIKASPSSIILFLRSDISLVTISLVKSFCLHSHRCFQRNRSNPVLVFHAGMVGKAPGIPLFRIQIVGSVEKLQEFFTSEIAEVMSKVSLKHLNAPCILYNLNNCASHSRYFSDELDAQFFIKIS